MPPSQLDPVITPDIDAIDPQGAGQGPGRPLPVRAGDEGRHHPGAGRPAGDRRRPAGGRRRSTRRRPGWSRVPAAAAARARGDPPGSGRGAEAPGRRRTRPRRHRRGHPAAWASAPSALYQAFGPQQQPSRSPGRGARRVITYPQAQAASPAHRAGTWSPRSSRHQRRRRRHQGHHHGAEPGRGHLGPSWAARVTLTLNVGPKTAKIPADLLGDERSTTPSRRSRTPASPTSSTRRPTSEDADAEEDEVARRRPGRGRDGGAGRRDRPHLRDRRVRGPRARRARRRSQGGLSDARTRGVHQRQAAVEQETDPTRWSTGRRHPVGIAKRRTPQPAAAPSTPPPSPSPSASPSSRDRPSGAGRQPGRRICAGMPPGHHRIRRALPEVDAGEASRRRRPASSPSPTSRPHPAQPSGTPGVTSPTPGSTPG